LPGPSKKLQMSQKFDEHMAVLIPSQHKMRSPSTIKSKEQ
jgi:hypothetical protein